MFSYFDIVTCSPTSNQDLPYYWVLLNHATSSTYLHQPLPGSTQPQNSKLSILTENWHIQYLGGAISESWFKSLKFRSQNLFWANFSRKSQSCLFCPKIGTHGIWWMLLSIPTLVFWISNPKSIFGQTWLDSKYKNKQELVTIRVVIHSASLSHSIVRSLCTC